LKLSISDKGSWHCLINLSFMRTISRYNNNEIPLTSSSDIDRTGGVIGFIDDFNTWVTRPSAEDNTRAI
jgi:hypothetical protein